MYFQFRACFLSRMKADDVTLEDVERAFMPCLRTCRHSVSIIRRSVSWLFITLSCASGSALKTANMV